jgi:hypothetical protein
LQQLLQTATLNVNKATNVANTKCQPVVQCS